MKKFYIFLLICLSTLLVSCVNNTKDVHNVFKIALSSTIDNVKSNTIMTSATTTDLYIQNSDNKSYTLGMAKSMPIDVTNEFIDEKWNIQPGDFGRAWKIELRDDLCWENGEKITAQDFIDTIVITYDCGFDVINGNYYERDRIEAGKTSIEDLGIKVIDNSLILIFDTKITAAQLCRYLSFSSFDLVHKKTYENSFLRDEDGNIVFMDYTNIPINEYGTSVDKYLSYGPYKLVEMNQNVVRLVKNENWYGYKNYSEEYYQTDEIVFEYLEDYSNSYDLLVEGKYHKIDASKYLKSSEDNSFNDVDEKYIKNGFYILPTVYSLVIKPEYERLLEKQEKYENRNYTILCLPEFRKALMYSLDWNSLITPLENQKYLMPSYSYVKYCLHPFYTYRTCVNNYTGEYFHESAEFKELYEECFSEFFDNTDKKQKAIELFNEAYRKALEEDYLTEDDVIYIDFAVPYDRTNKVDVIISRWKEVVGETIFSDKIKFVGRGTAVIGQTPYSDIYLSFYYQGDYGLDCVIDLYEQIAPPEYQNQKYRNQEVNITFDKIIDINGKEYKDVTLIATIDEWLKGYNDNSVSTTIDLNNETTEEVVFTYRNNPEVTNKIMAECEKSVFNDYCLLSTIEQYNPMIISDSINLNYESNAHYYNIDFRYITYN